jgi:hypothetical protein
MRENFVTVVIALLTCIEVNTGVIEFDINGKEGVVFHEPFPLNMKGVIRWNPSLEQVLYVDSLVFSKHPCEFGGCQELKFIDNEPVIAKNKSGYLIQAYGFCKKNENILFINYFWKEYNESHPDWKKQLVSVIGSSSYYWDIQYNFTTKAYSVGVGGLEIISGVDE